MNSANPSVSVRIAGAGEAFNRPRQMSEIRVQQRLGLPAQCEVSFSTGEAAGDELAEAVAIGLPLEVCVGADETTLFEGDITAVEYVYPLASPPALRVRGYDALHRLRKRQHVRAYPECSLGSLLRQLAGPDSELLGEDLRWPLLIQHQQNDLEFLAGQAALAGCYPLARGGRIYLVPLSGLGRLDDIPLDYGRNLFEARVEANANADCDAMRVFGWETAACGTPQQQEKSAQIGRQVEMQVAVRDVGGMPERMLLNQGLDDEPAARALARAELERRKAGSVVVWGRAEGSSAIQPGAPAAIGGLAPAVCGRYILTSATHTFDYASGYTVEFSSEPPLAPLRSRCAVAALGVVTDVRDPRHLGRVRARLPAYAGVETGWMPVACPGAGKEKGLVSLPDPGDRVLVLLAHEDPASGIVLGGLYAPESPPDDGISAGRAERYTWTTKEGQRIRLDQDGHVVLIENGAGARIEMKGDRLILQAGQIDFRRS